jgi:hypothetical protein
MDDIDALRRELAKAQAENAQLRAQIDAQRGGVDVQKVLDRINKENESNKAYQAEMQAQFDRLYKRDEKKDTPPQTTRYY